jgi:predicted RND superfamily exporter protein
MLNKVKNGVKYIVANWKWILQAIIIAFIGAVLALGNFVFYGHTIWELMYELSDTMIVLIILILTAIDYGYYKIFVRYCESEEQQ